MGLKYQSIETVTNGDKEQQKSIFELFLSKEDFSLFACLEICHEHYPAIARILFDVSKENYRFFPVFKGTIPPHSYDKITPDKLNYANFINSMESLIAGNIYLEKPLFFDEKKKLLKWPDEILFKDLFLGNSEIVILNELNSSIVKDEKQHKILLGHKSYTKKKELFSLLNFMKRLYSKSKPRNFFESYTVNQLIYQLLIDVFCAPKQACFYLNCPESDLTGAQEYKYFKKTYPFDEKNKKFTLWTKKHMLDCIKEWIAGNK